MNRSKIQKTTKPENPYFCPVKDPETGKKCGKLMNEIDSGYYSIYGMCRDCFNKYNSHVSEVDNYDKNSINEV